MYGKMQHLVSMIPLILVGNEQQINEYLQKSKKTGEIHLIISPKQTEFSIDEIKELIREANIAHIEKRVYVLFNFHKSSLEAQNALLKIIEEPPENTQFILTVANQNRLLPTIISRSKIIILNKKKLQKVSPAVKKILDDFISNKTDRFPNFESIDTLPQMLDFFRLRLQQDKESSKIIKEILKVQNLVENNNLNKQLAIDHLLIFLKKAYSIK